MSIAQGLLATWNIFHNLLTGLSAISWCLLISNNRNESPFNSSSDNLLVESHSWHQYVRSSNSHIIEPTRILSQYTKGNVTNPNGLIEGGKPTVLNRDAISHDAPTIVIDFGQNTVGIISIEFVGSLNYSTTRPGIRLAFSETLKYLSDVSDFSRSYNVSFHSKPYNIS